MSEPQEADIQIIDFSQEAKKKSKKKKSTKAKTGKIYNIFAMRGINKIRFGVI